MKELSLIKLNSAKMNVQTCRIKPVKNRERDDMIHKAWMQISSDEISVKQFLENLSEFSCEDLIEMGMYTFESIVI